MMVQKLVAEPGRSVKAWRVDKTSGELMHALAGRVEGSVAPSSWEVLDGVNHLARMFNTRHVSVLRSGAPQLITELDSYSWPDRGDQPRMERVRPVKKNDHGCDALRYWAEGAGVPRTRPRRTALAGDPGR